MEARARRAAVWVAAALVLVAAVGVVYLRPSAAAPRSAAPPASPVARALAGVSFADARHGSVSLLPANGRTADEVAYVTSDGGATWHRGAYLEYLTGNLVVRRAERATGTERISADGGRTWRLLVEPDVHAVQSSPPVFVDPVHGWWLVFEPATKPTTSLWRTDDGGATWRPSGMGIPSGGFAYQVRFLDALRGALAYEEAGGARSLFVTDDGGVTWSRGLTPTSALPGQAVLGVSLYARGGTLLAWLTTVAGRVDPTSTIGTYALLSDDGGRTWSTPRPGPILDEYSPAPGLDDRGRLLVLDDRRLWTSDDQGATWTARVIQAPAGLLPLGPLVAGSALLAPAVARTGAITRPVDTLLRSTDGGVHWDRVPLP